MPTVRDVLARLRFAARLLTRSGQQRYLVPWIRSQQPAYLLRVGLPWLCFAAIAALDRLDLHGWRVFEYGSGGSTRYWLRRGASVVSVEHDAAWYASIHSLVPSDAPLDYRLTLPEPAPPGPADPSDPTAYRSGDPAYAGCSFARYAAEIDAFPQEYFNLVLVDGRARPSCVLHALPRLRRGGLLILDNSDRAYYTARLGPLLAGWRATVYAGAAPGPPVFTQTTFYVRTE